MTYATHAPYERAHSTILKFYFALQLRSHFIAKEINILTGWCNLIHKTKAPVTQMKVLGKHEEEGTRAFACLALRLTLRQ